MTHRMVPIILTEEDKTLTAALKANKVAKDVRILRKQENKKGDWKVFMFELLYEVQEKDQFGNTLRTIMTNRYTTVEVRPPFLGGRNQLHESQNTRESRKIAEDAFDYICSQMEKYETRGHL